MYRSTRECIDDLARTGQLLTIHEEVDPCLEMAAIHRRVHRDGGPAVFYAKVKGSPFPAASNLFGTRARADFLFRRSLRPLQTFMDGFGNPLAALPRVKNWFPLAATALAALPRRVRTGLPAAARLKDVRAGMRPRWRSALPVLECECRIQDLPQIQSWPMDGGAFITLPQVCSLPPASRPRILQSNLGMYRVQLSGNDYLAGREVGLHYQIHRGIGIHHAQAIASGRPLKISIFVGGPPAHTVAAMMPMPEGLSEFAFAGMLAARAFRYALIDGWVISAEADFCILGTVAPDTKPEGPFGDHLGYYSLKHPFPYLKVERVFHRRGAVWPFTVVGRPPQEDSVFGAFVHRLTGNVLPTQVKGVREVQAVDAAGVHSLLFSIGSERYVPYAPREPREILTQANALLGFNQISLTKYLFICAGEDDPGLRTSDSRAYLTHVLERADWRKDLHFQTRTTMDTLDYTGHDLNKGSKLIVAVAGEKRNALCPRVPADLALPGGFERPRLILPGLLVVQAPSWGVNPDGDGVPPAGDPRKVLEHFCAQMDLLNPDLLGRQGVAWMVLVDDSDFCARTLDNFLWVCFLRSNPSDDTYGIQPFIQSKHWGCHQSLVTDARIKPHHSPVLRPDAAVEVRAAERILGSRVTDPAS